MMNVRISPANVVRPATIQERIDVIDITRGFALLGILLVNMSVYSWPVYAYLTDLYSKEGIDRLATWFVSFAAEGKFYSLFSFLFGLSLYLFMSRVEARGARFIPLYVRRLLVLFGFGLVHGFGFWAGDILIPYAFLGFLLLWFRKRSTRTILIVAVISLSLPLVLQGGSVGLIQLARTAGGDAVIDQAFAESRAQALASNTQALQAYSQGTLSEILAQHVTDELYMLPLDLFIAPNICAMFLLGLYMGKREVFRNLPQSLPFFRRLLVAGLAVGIVGNLIYVVAGEQSSPIIPSRMSVLAWAGQAIGAPALSMAYLSAIVLLAQRSNWHRLLAPLSYVGRMALSNYLLQTLICTTIFYNYGLGLYGTLGPAAGLVLAVAIYLVQIPISVWWLSHWRFGPAEWLWRSLTYGHWQPMGLRGEAVPA